MLKNISLVNFRNYQNLCIDTDSDIVVLYGNNGHGKTNFLEAVYFLSLLRSFRLSSVKSLKNISANDFYVSGIISTGQSWDRKIEIEYSLGKRKLKVDERPILKSGDFIRYIKPIVFSHEDLNIITGSSKLRRRYLDILISNISPEYFTALREYMLAVKSRNALLRGNSANKEQMLSAFDSIIAANGSVIIKKRYEAIDKIKKLTEVFLKEIKGSQISFNMKYISRFSENITEGEFLELLRKERNKDIRKGFTSLGPHTEDIDFLYDNKNLRYFGSLGQCRITSLCLKMSEVKIVRDSDNTGNIIALIDDVTGELDSKTKDSFLNTVSYADQLFFTLTDSRENDVYFENALKFNINEGQIKGLNRE